MKNDLKNVKLSEKNESIRCITLYHLYRNLKTIIKQHYFYPFIYFYYVYLDTHIAKQMYGRWIEGTYFKYIEVGVFGGGENGRKGDER